MSAFSNDKFVPKEGQQHPFKEENLHKSSDRQRVEDKDDHVESSEANKE